MFIINIFSSTGSVLDHTKNDYMILFLRSQIVRNPKTTSM